MEPDVTQSTTAEAEALDINAVRDRQDDLRDAFARVLRTGEPDGDRRDEYARAREKLFAAALESARDVPDLRSEIGRLKDEIHDRQAVTSGLRAQRDSLADVLDVLLRL